MSGKTNGLTPETQAVQASFGEAAPFGAVVPPIHVATTFVREHDESGAGPVRYTRDRNPGYATPEAVLAALEGGAEALLFASGMAAAAVIRAVPSGSRIAVPHRMYWGFRAFLEREAADRGLTLDYYENDDIASLEAALHPGATRLLWIETPANPTWEVTDIARAAELGHQAGAQVAVDSTVATPVITRPLELGADIVMHSATKYLNGHSDVLAGALVCRAADDFWRTIRERRGGDGAVLGPFESWLLLRGMRTLFLRVRQASANAAEIAGHFRNHPAVAAVLYPGLPDHPGHAVASRQMRDGLYGGMLSIRLAGGEAAARSFAARLGLFAEATSLGGVESLAEHRRSVEGPNSPVPADLVRLSIGVEDVRDLIADIDRTLASL
ncbi:trans-sulfuration enzyme family protein [Oceanibacterium hippocampi]|uniref:Cystathionine gamma-synthase n=1 Tax=Oceanibacterium hippocampi TaxID=745714 RepID=A0A1Y5TYY1_9PROT|nr:PLP-dependent aspartate aminotransferase family protein [Oceanibacterium hippocampi]SLN77054.1 Cystathionine gamma-synthase [Oceanibacterium hippocampi]